MALIDQIKEAIKEDYYVQNFANEGQRFVAWYLRNIHLRDMNEARDDITDGADDKQIDAVVVDDQRSTVYIIQSKFVEGSTIDAGPIREVFSSWLQLKDLVRLQEVANSRLKRKLAEVAHALDEEYEVSFELVVTSRLTDSARKDLATFQDSLASMTDKDDISATINLVDLEELERRYSVALDRGVPSINHSFNLEAGKFLSMSIAGTKVVLAAIPLRDCVSIPGVKDGTLFQKNVRQSLGLNNAVNKGIKSTIYGDKHRDFFFFHNGITAICDRMALHDHTLDLRGLSVVNGCQSLNTILSCSERVRSLEETYVMFRFYEIPLRDRADRISISTNSQSAVKPRDLRSNDRRVLALKKAFEQKYPFGYFVTKRGEAPPAERTPSHVLDLSDLGKYLISWHAQRPNVAYNEAKIFDKHFEQLFKREYNAEDAQALNLWMQEIMRRWVPSNPLSFNQTLLAMKAYAPYHHLYAVSMLFSISNSQSDRVPRPSRCYEQAKSAGAITELVDTAGVCLNSALTSAADQPQPANRVFSPPNWIKAKTCLSAINAAINTYFTILPGLPGGKDALQRLRTVLMLPIEAFEYRWAAD
ncbi:MAG: AIPR family protein [Bacillota bacterium]